MLIQTRFNPAESGAFSMVSYTSKTKARFLKNRACFLGVLFFLFWSAPGISQKPVLFQWLIGVWEINTGNGMINESWQMADDSTLVGKSVFIKNGKDTIPQESLTLALRNGEWYYISTVVSQNNNQPVEFKVIYHGRSEFISENPSHDFPQRIAYRKVSDQLMYASIEGRKNGKYGKQNFNFNKKNTK